MTSPILKNKIYLAGPSIYDSNKSIAVYDAIAKHVEDLGHDCINWQITQKLISKPNTEYQKARVKTLLDADLIVTVEDWFSSDFARKEVEIARILNIDVIHFSNLKKHFQCQA